MISQTLIKALNNTVKFIAGKNLQANTVLDLLAIELEKIEQQEANEEERRHNEIMQQLDPHGQN